MLELLALPKWGTGPTPLAAWVGGLESQGLVVAATRESTGVSWIEVESLRLRGYVVTEEQAVEAINFVIEDPDPAPARRALEEAAKAVAWELHEEDADDEDVDL